jgi:hypothetical protein
LTVKANISIHLGAVAVLGFMALTPIFAAGQKRFPFREEMPLSLSSGEKGHAELSLPERTLQRGKRYTADYTFRNTGGGYWVYNPLFMRLIPLPGQLAIYNSKKEYVGDLIEWEGGSQKGVTADDWFFLYDGSHVGTGLDFTAGYVPMTRNGSMNSLLPPGQYFIQLILYKSFLSEMPKYVLGNRPNFYKTFDRSEIARSNVIPVEIVDPASQ